MSRIITTEEIENGMVLKEPILNASGGVLLGSGVTLNEKHKKYFKMWGISSLTIQSDDINDDNNTEIDEATYNKSKEEFLKRFNWEPSNNIEEELVEMGILNKLYKNE